MPRERQRYRALLDLRRPSMIGLAMRNGRRRCGFSLIETLVALAIVALTMTIGMSLLAQQTGITRRVQAHHEALRIVESTLESVRAGAVPLSSGRVELPVETVHSDAMTVWLEVLPRAEPAGLHEVTIEARYVVKRRTLRRSVRTLVWGSP